MTTSTITLDDAAGTIWDVAIVGAGPAGSACAAACARAGARTLLIDRAAFPREKVCGCCLGARGAAIADSLLGDGALTRLGAAALTGMEIRTDRRRATMRLAGGVALGRDRLDAALIDQAEHDGSATLLGDGARLLPTTGADHRTLLLGSGPRVRARVVVAADGIAGRTLADEPGMGWRIAPHSRMGAGCTLPGAAMDLPPGAVLMCCGREGYVGMVRLGDGAIDVACALDPASVKRAGGPGALAAAIVQETGAHWPAGDHLWRGVPALSRSRCVAGHRVFAIGDAAGYVEPFTGEGMTWALESALLAAPLAVAGSSDWSVSVERAWIRRHRAAIGRRQRACRVIAHLLRRPGALDLALRAMERAPESGDALAVALHGRSEAA
jgi:flavin-dependent dehydrogenase